MKKLCTISFYGSIWGITEATIGYFTHMAHLHIANYLMIPISFWCMIMAYNRLKELFYVPLCVAAVAASIKLIDLVALPSTLPSYYVLSPASHILALGLIFSLYILIFHEFKKFCLRPGSSAGADSSGLSATALPSAQSASLATPGSSVGAGLSIPTAQTSISPIIAASDEPVSDATTAIAARSHCPKKTLRKNSLFTSHKSFAFSAVLGSFLIILASVGMSFYRLWIISVTTGVCIEPVSYDGIFTMKLIANAVWMLICLVLSIYLYQHNSSIFSIKKEENFEIYNAMPALTAALGITLVL